MKREGIPAKTKLVGPAAIYAMTPCTEQTARVAIERMIQPPLILLELAARPELPIAARPGEDQADFDRVCEECGHTPEDGHSEMCSFADADDDES